MPNEYDGETCEGCAYWDPPCSDEEAPYCFFHRKTHAFTSAEADHKEGFQCGKGDRCDELKPSLVCRQVRALEKLASCVASDGVFNTYENFK
jgi:hypothetical protein